MRGLYVPAVRQTEQYRLIVKSNQRELVFDSATFPTFEAAQSRVATAVCEHARGGTIAGVEVQRLSVNGTTVWRTVRSWDQTVVRRILAQKSGIVLPIPTAKPRNGKASVAAATHSAEELRVALHAVLGPPAKVSIARGHNGRAKTAEHYEPTHRSYRWHYLTTAAIVTVALVGVLVLQTGGQLSALLGYSAPSQVSALEIPENPNLGSDVRVPDTRTAGAPAEDRAEIGG